MVFRIEEVEFFALIWSKMKFTLRYFDLWPIKHTGNISFYTEKRQSNSQFHDILSFKVYNLINYNNSLNINNWEPSDDWCLRFFSLILIF